MKNIAFIGGYTGKHDLCGRIAAHLKKSAADDAVPDYSSILVVLPGKNAIRLLSDQLLLQEEKGIFPPDFTTVGSLIRFGMDDPAISQPEQIMLWQRVLNEADTRCLDKIFPCGVDTGNTQLITNLAENIASLQTELNRELLSFKTAAEMLKLKGNLDYERWQNLAGLEEIFLHELQSAGLPDTLKCLNKAIDDLTVFRQYSKVVLAGVPDLPEPAKKRLEKLDAAGICTIEILVDATRELAPRFDEWGILKPESWSAYPLDFEKGNKKRIHTAQTPAEMAELVRDLAPDDEGKLDLHDTVIAVTDPSFAPWIKKELSGIPDIPGIYDPAGIALPQLRLISLIELLDDLAENPSRQVVRALFLHTDFRRWLAEKNGCSGDALLEMLDGYLLKHLPEKIDRRGLFTNADTTLQNAIHAMLEIRDRLRETQDPITTLREVLNRICANASGTKMLGISFDQEAEVIAKQLNTFQKSKILSQLERHDLCRALIKACANTRVYPEHIPGAMEICGFLDLPFRSAKRVILCGMNEGLLPETLKNTNFINNSKRQLLGLPDNARRFARDCFYINSILDSCEDSHFIYCSIDKNEKIQQPSSLFFTGNVNLAEHAGILFSAMPVSGEQLEENGDFFHIKPDFSTAFTEKDATDDQVVLSVTTFKNLLRNPLYAFFANTLKLQAFDYDAQELNASDLGTLIHSAVEHFNAENCKNEEEAGNALAAIFAKELGKKCGFDLPLPISIQQDMVLPRLRKTAALLWQNQKSFKVIEREWNLNDQKGISYGGAKIKGKIDRIELSMDGRTLRLIDFKTGDTAVQPDAAHINSKMIFKDLQLPLYCELLPRDPEFRSKYPEINFDSIRLECGYFNIPKTVLETGYAMWSRSEETDEPAQPAKKSGRKKKQITLDDVLPLVEKEVRTIVDMIKTLLRKGHFMIDPLKPGMPYDTFDHLLLPNPGRAISNAVWLNEKE